MNIPSNTEDVKPRRRYHSTRRQAQAAQTRQDIIAAALRLFLQQGYAATTMAGIAQAAGVVVETMYRAFGSKAALFKAVVEAAVAGGAARAAVPPEQRPAVRAMIQEPNPRRLLELHAATQPGIHARAGPLHRVLVEAAAADPELAAVWTQLETQRLDGMRRITQLLADRGALRPELSVEEAGDVLWTMNSLAVHDLLVLQRGWTPERYRDWLAATNARALLADPPQPSRPNDHAPRPP
jgi:AcrR family transcriptional regulator